MRILALVSKDSHNRKLKYWCISIWILSSFSDIFAVYCFNKHYLPGFLIYSILTEKLMMMFNILDDNWKAPNDCGPFFLTGLVIEMVWVRHQKKCSQLRDKWTTTQEWEYRVQLFHPIFFSPYPIFISIYSVLREMRDKLIPPSKEVFLRIQNHDLFSLIGFLDTSYLNRDEPRNVHIYQRIKL